MSGVIFEKMDWRVGEATNGLIILEKTGKVRTCCMTGARIGQKEMDQRRLQSRAEFHVRQKRSNVLFGARAIGRHLDGNPKTCVDGVHQTQSRMYNISCHVSDF